MFMTNEQGLIRSAHGIVPGTKEAPHSVTGGAIQVDGLALEINIIPAGNVIDWGRRISTVLDELKKALPAGHGIRMKGHHYFPEKYMETLHPDSLELGCDPDFDARTKAPNPAPNGATSLRTAAGHIHFGWTEEEVPDEWFFELCCDFVRHLDMSIGLYCYLLDPDKERKALYGKAGAFRPKPYGLEYRTPGNAWLQKAHTIATIFHISATSFRNYSNHSFYHKIRWGDLSERQVVALINNELSPAEERLTRRAAAGFLKDVLSVRNI